MEGKKVSSIEVQSKNKERVNIYLDGEYTFSCSAELVYVHNLKSGMEIAIDKFKEIVDEDNYIKAKNAALKFIERSYKSEKEISDKLLLKGYDEKIAERVMKFLRDYNFVNDEKFIEMYIKEKTISAGRNKIKYSLLRKGISEQLVLEAVDKIDNVLEQKIAKKLFDKKYAILKNSEKDKRKLYKKLGDFLIRNGFSGEIVSEILRSNSSLMDEEKVNCNEINNEEEESNCKEKELKELAEKRYRIIIKSEKDSMKTYKKLSEYLMRRGYSFQEIKPVLKEIISASELM